MNVSYTTQQQQTFVTPCNVPLPCKLKPTLQQQSCLRLHWDGPLFSSCTEGVVLWIVLCIMMGCVLQLLEACVKNGVPFFFQQLIYSDLWQEIMRAGEPMRNVSSRPVV